MARGCPVDELVAAGRLVVLDAPTTLAGFMVNGEPDREEVSARGRRRSSAGCAARSSAGLTAYGEMVDILAAQGNFIAAEHLETLWNTLSTECSFRLLCGYSSAHFGDERTRTHLDRICAQHTDIRLRAQTDLLGLVAARGSALEISHPRAIAELYGAVKSGLSFAGRMADDDLLTPERLSELLARLDEVMTDAARLRRADHQTAQRSAARVTSRRSPPRAAAAPRSSAELDAKQHKAVR